MSKNISSCSLLSFAAGKRVFVGTFVNKTNNESFKSVVFQDKEGKNTFAQFSKKLGAISVGDIARRKNELVVYTNLDTDRHYLGVPGDNRWEEVAL